MRLQAVVILSPLANGIVRRIDSMITSDISFAWGFRRQLNKLLRMINTARMVLRAAEESQGEVVSVRVWLNELRDVLYDVDDLLDDISTEDLRSQEENLLARNQVSNFFSICKRKMLALKLTDRFRAVDKRWLTYLTNETGRFNFLVHQNQVVKGADKVKDHDFPFIYWSTVVGRDDERKAIIDFLAENRGRNPIVTISGDRGVGKTTLARSVVEDKVWEKSAPPIWCDNLDLNTTFEVLRNRLQRELGGKEPLLVLDDVSYLTRAQCNELRHLLKVGVAGVMITTTNTCIADLVGESFTSCDEKGNEDEVLRKPTQSHNQGIGIREGKELIIQFLLNNHDKKLSTLSLVGIIGHGNTLLESICEDERVKSQFEYSKRVCVSCEEFNLKKIVEYILGDGNSDKTLQRLQLELRKQLQQKKFLLVLEDMVDMNPYQWDKLRDLLMNDKVGNKVLITARDKQLARVADSTIQLEPLYPDTRKHLEPYPHMRKHLEPLYVCDVYEKTNSSLLDIMKLGFDALPSSIKICFVYSVCFPVHPPSRQKITQQWIAQGFIEHSENNQMLEDLASKYFDVLLSRSFFYNLAQDDFMAETRFQVHDIVCDLAHLVSEGECSVTSSDEIENIPSSVHHVAFFNESKEEFPSALMRFKKLRTFKWEKFGSMSTTTLNVHQFSRTLRVLDLSCSVFQELTSSIDELYHLRYLDLSQNVYLESLPSSLFKLYNLETLRVDGCAIEELPREIMKLRKLRNLYACTEQGSIAEGGICGLTSLRILHLDPIYNMETLPEGLQNLKLLETLVLKFCSNLSFSENDMKGLTSLRSLTITHLEKQSIIPRGLLDAASLSSLGLFYCVGLTSLPEWLGKLQYLRRLCVDFCPNLTALPEGIGLPSGLQYLNIRGCPGLSRRFEGEDWPKISHIGEIHLEGKIVQLTPEIRLSDSSSSGKKTSYENKNSFVFPSSSSYGAPMESAVEDPVAPISEIKSRDGSIEKNELSDSSCTSISLPATPRTEGEILQSPNLKSFSFDDLKVATRDFRPDGVIGEGRFGCVFKGWIDEQSLTAAKPGTGEIIAVKRLNQEYLQGPKEWLAEVNYVGQLYHPNLVKLIGYCLEDDHRLLVYEFMPKGCLEHCLFPRNSSLQPLPWTIRMKVALDAAKGLQFLHEKAYVIHRDFNTSNILLDRKYNAKLSDFLLAKDGPTEDKSHVSTRVMGTYCYAAPEYIAIGRLTTKSDIYSFGVVLLEMLTGRRALDKNLPSDKHNLVEWAKPYMGSKRKVLTIMDTRIQGQYTLSGAQKAANLAMQCLALEPKYRPNIKQVVAALEQLQKHRGSPSD